MPIGCPTGRPLRRRGDGARSVLGARAGDAVGRLPPANQFLRRHCTLGIGWIEVVGSCSSPSEPLPSRHPVLHDNGGQDDSARRPCRAGRERTHLYRRMRRRLAVCDQRREPRLSRSSRRIPTLHRWPASCPAGKRWRLSGFQSFHGVMADDYHRDHGHLMHWSGGTFEPETFEVSEIQEPTARFACRQTIGKAVFTKAKPHHRCARRMPTFGIALLKLRAKMPAFFRSPGREQLNIQLPGQGG